MVAMRQGRRSRDDQVWWEKYALYYLFISNEGHGNVIHNPDNTAKYPYLAKWIGNQRSKYKRRQFLTQEQIDALENTGMIWDLDKLYWQRDLILYDRYFEKYADGDPSGYTTVRELRTYVVDGSLDDGFESDGQEVKLGYKIYTLRKRIAYQCWENPDYDARREELNGTKRNKHLKTCMDLTPSQINDLIRVNFTMKCDGRYRSTTRRVLMPLNKYLESRRQDGLRNIDYRYEVPNNYK